MPNSDLFSKKVLEKSQRVIIRTQETIRRSREVLRISREVQADRGRAEYVKALWPDPIAELD